MAERENESTPVRPVGSPFHARDTDDNLRPENPETRTHGSDRHAARSIVVGIDGSSECRAALHWAIREAEVTGAEISAVAVWQQPVQFGISAMPPVPQQAFADEAREWLAEAVPEARRGEDAPASIHTTVEHGDPTTVLLDHAMRADMLVLGNKGRGGLAGAMIGSVALRCAHHARCPVVLVPTRAASDEPPRR